MAAFALVLLFGMGAGDAVAADPPPMDCGVADSLRGAKLFTEAISAYGDLLKSYPNLKCAADGLAAAKAESLKAAFASVSELDRRGFHDEARDQLKKVLTDNPGEPTPPDLVGLQYGLPAAWSNGFPLLPPAQDALKWIAILLGLFVVFVLGFRLVAPRLTWRAKIVDLTASEPSLGKSVAQLIGDAIDRLEKDGGGDRLWVSDSTAQDFKIPAEITDAVPQLKGLAILAPLVNSLWPPRLLTVGGTIHGAGDLGVGITMTLQDPNGRVADSATLWEGDFESWSHPITDKTDPSEYHRLATSAAVWTHYAIAKRLNSGSAGFITKDWRSYAYFASGADWQARHQLGRARSQYWNALELDPGNWLPLFNLADLDWRQAGEGEVFDLDDFWRKTQRALDALDVVGKRMHERAIGTAQREWTAQYPDLSWFRARYVRVAIRVHRHALGIQRLDRELVSKAQELAVLTVEGASDTPRPELANEKLRVFLRSKKTEILAACAVAFAMRFPWWEPAEALLVDDAFALAKDPPAHYRLVAHLETLKPLSRFAHYDLACYYSLLAGPARSYWRVPAWLELCRLGFEHLRVAGDGQGTGFAAWAGRDPTLAELRDGLFAAEFDAIMRSCHDIAAYAPPMAAGASEAKAAKKKADES